MMNKPVKQSKEAFDFHECTTFLEQKYNMNTEDYAGHFGKPAIHSPTVRDAKPEEDGRPPYWNFWHFICDHASPSNGSYFTMHQEWEDSMQYEWQKEILKLYLDEFGENDKIEFYVWW